MWFVFLLAALCGREKPTQPTNNKESTWNAKNKLAVKTVGLLIVCYWNSMFIPARWLIHEFVLVLLVVLVIPVVFAIVMCLLAGLSVFLLAAICVSYNFAIITFLVAPVVFE